MKAFLFNCKFSDIGFVDHPDQLLYLLEIHSHDVGFGFTVG
jgi:hypothetical protein